MFDPITKFYHGIYRRPVNDAVQPRELGVDPAIVLAVDPQGPGACDIVVFRDDGADEVEMRIIRNVPFGYEPGCFEGNN